MADMKKGREAQVTHGLYCNESVVFIQLTQGHRAIVDAGVWPRIERDYGRRWLANRRAPDSYVYARKQMANEAGESKLVTLARAVMEAEPGDRVEALNGDPLDCRLVNLHKLETKAAAKRRQEFARKRAEYQAQRQSAVGHSAEDGPE